MASIKIMDEDLANKIAAGEVVERCASVVKELVENSIDAHAGEIKIELIESGIREIKITDDGNGMSEEDAKMAFIRHATSKLQSVNDLFRINTLGFRGEALPSIASVSDITLMTSTKTEGVTIKIKGGKLESISQSSLFGGTSITVRNLFYNTPARLKHLASIYVELAHIVNYVYHMALSYPNIKFILSNDGKTLLSTSKHGNMLKVINGIYGLEVTKKMIPVEGHNHDYTISGYIAKPEITRSNRDHMITIVNGRVIHNSALNKAINDSYHTYKPDTRYPIVILAIDADPSLMDVNIHPTKQDIRFSKLDELLDLINKTITNCLETALLIPKIETISDQASVKYENSMLQIERFLVNEAQEKNLQNVKEAGLLLFESKSEVINKKPISNDTDDMINVIEVPELYPVGVVLGTYVVCQNERGMYLIDQHAAKERINYEQYSYHLTHPSHHKTDMLVPINKELPQNEFIILKQRLDILNDMGFEISVFGLNSITIKAHPTWLMKGCEADQINHIIDLMVNEYTKFSLDEFYDRLAMSLSCKHAIKGNEYVTITELEALIKELRTCNNPWTCPHGRPVIIHYSIYELEKLFKRAM